MPFDWARSRVEAVDFREVPDALLERAQAVVKLFIDRQIRLDRHDIRLLSLRQIGVVEKSTVDITVEFLWIFNDHAGCTDVVENLRDEFRLLM